MTNNARVSDAQVRRLAATTFDRNVVVIAGAGTGKTTLLVNRLVHTLMREPDPVPVTSLVALTFTNKAATEMKTRLRERLTLLSEAVRLEERPAGTAGVVASELYESYGLSLDQIHRRAEAALRDLEKAQIGTLHSFAAHLLRLHPIESGIDPAFREDDGSRLDELFAVEWELWLSRELGPEGVDHDRWRGLLEAIGLPAIHDMARALCGELIELEELNRQVMSTGIATPLRDWIAAQYDRADELLARYDRERRRKIESSLASARELFGLVLDRGAEAVDELRPESREALRRDIGAVPAGWEQADFAECTGLIRTARLMLQVDTKIVRDLVGIILPFAKRVRTIYGDNGWVSFDGLLTKARGLLREHPSVRERLKAEYRAVLVDEFQDTDPLQYEIILYLVECAGQNSVGWQDVRLAPGKLFIVGDPKQSIYAFRRADIEAFDRVVQKVRTSGGLVYDLVTNFRTHGVVLEVVNAVFDRLFRQREHVQPENVRLEAGSDRPAGYATPGVELRLVAPASGEEEFDTASATRAEADALARWLKELLPRDKALSAAEMQATIRPGHVALLFRALTHAEEYLEALHRYGIPYVTDGEKHFYRRQEIVDLVNILRALENPHDGIAMIGLLRSPIGGIPDHEVYELRTLGALDYRAPHRLTPWASPRVTQVRRLYMMLAELSAVVARCPLPVAIEKIYTELPVLELAAASLHGEQAVANLAKVRKIAEELAGRPGMTLAGFVDLLIDCVSQQPEEAESALVEESLEAVNVLTIHKAKGLEFSVVVLPGMHHAGGRRAGNFLLAQDWSGGIIGLAVGDRCNLGAAFVRQKYQEREEAERRRLLYVGMTRAKERLVLSGGLPSRRPGGTFLELLEEPLTEPVGRPGRSVLEVGGTSLSQVVLSGRDRAPRQAFSHGPQRTPAVPSQPFAQVWQERANRLEAWRATPVQVTPTMLQHGRIQKPIRPMPESSPAARNRLLGTLTHRVLQSWCFAQAPSEFEGRARAVCAAGLPEEFAADTEVFVTEMVEMLLAFAQSGAYQELRDATILGREIPFAIPWPVPSTQSSALSTQHCVMEGVIDVLYRTKDNHWVADYKTDHVLADEVESRVAFYRPQVGVYTEAVARGLGLELEKVGAKLIFLRLGQAVELI